MKENRIEVSVRADSSYDLKGVLAEIEHRHKYEMMKKGPTVKQKNNAHRFMTCAEFRKKQKYAVKGAEKDYVQNHSNRKSEGRCRENYNRRESWDRPCKNREKSAVD